MDTTKPLLTGKAAFIVGTIGGLAAAAGALIPAPWGTLVMVLGFTACVVAGVAAPPPKVTEGKPILQGAALTAAVGLVEPLHMLYGMLPAGWPQGLGMGVLGLLAWLTGRALPALSSKPVPAANVEAKAAEAAAGVKTLDDAVNVMKGPQP